MKSSDTNPERFHEEKERLERGERLPTNRGKRDFFCRTCGKTERGFFVPRGWYGVERFAGRIAHHIRLGIYCSIGCMARQMARLLGVEKDVEAKGVDFVEDSLSRKNLPEEGS